MHEICAMLLYVLLQDIQHEKQPSSTETTLELCTSYEYIEHDLFWCFHYLMKDLGPLYYVEKKDIQEEEETLPPMLSSCHRVRQILSVVDENTHAHLESLHIEPQLFCLRWFRLLFSREFHMTDTLVLWDWILAENYMSKIQPNTDSDSIAIYMDLITTIEYFSIEMVNVKKKNKKIL